MNWKRSARQNLLLALLFGVAANAVYFGLMSTRALHGFAVKALGPAISLVLDYLDPNCNAPLRCYLEEFAANIILYWMAIFVLLMALDVVRRITRKASA